MEVIEGCGVYRKRMIMNEVGVTEPTKTFRFRSSSQA